MRRNTILTAILSTAVVLGIGACTAEYIDDANGYSTAISNSIQVNAMIGNAALTKGGDDPTAPESYETTGSDLASFTLWAWQDKTDGTKIDGKTVTKADNAWSIADGPYYWPEDTVRFAAYAENNKAVSLTGKFSGENDKTKTFSNTYNVKDSTNQGDPIFAYIATPKPQDANAVPLTFQHMLSRVSINICAPYFSENHARVLSFGFSTVDVKGKFSYTCGNDTTNKAFKETLWSEPTKGFVGDTVSSKDATRWYTKGAAADTAYSGTTATPSAWVSGNGPVVPQNISGTTARLSYTNGSNTVTVPWLNVIPGTNVADSIFVTYEYYNPNLDHGEGKKTGGWVNVTARVAIPSGSVPTKQASNSQGNESYNPGYQYVYNIRILGQETDDASVTEAQIEVATVTVSEWTSEGTSDITTGEGQGSGRNLKEIIESAPMYSTVTLNKDVDLKDCGTINVTKDMTIDLASHTITADTSGVIFRISSGAKVVIKGGTLTDGEVVDNNNVQAKPAAPRRVKTKATKAGGSDSDTTGVVRVSGGATLTLGASGSADGVTITSTTAKHSCIYVEGASTVSIANGTFTTTAENTSAVTKDDDENTKVEVETGGSATFEENGVEVIPSDVVDYKDAVSVASFADLTAAISGTATHVKLTSDIEVTSIINISKDFIIDLNGKDITSDSIVKLFEVKKAKLTLTGSGTIKTTATGSSNNYYMITVAGDKDNSSATGYGLTIGENVALASSVYAVQVAADGSAGTYGVTVDIASKSVDVVYSLVTINGQYTATTGNVPEVIIRKTVGATDFKTNTGNLGLYLAGYGKTTIESGATIKGYDSAIEIRAGELTINGGTFEATAESFSCTANKSGTTTVGAAIAIAQHTTKKDISVTISGGTFTGVKALNECNPQGNNDPTPQVTINVTGGTFNGGINIIDDSSTSISAGTFTDLRNAAKYVADNATIKLACDTTITSRYDLTAAKNYTIDLNSHKITVHAQSGNGSAFNFVKDTSCTVHIQNGTIDASTYEATPNGETDAIVARNGATVYLDSLNVSVKSKNGSCAYAFDGSHIYIDGGTYENSTTEAYDYHLDANQQKDWKGLVVNQANVTTQLVEIIAGTFKGQNPADGDDSGLVTTFIATGSTASYDSDTRTCTVTASSDN